MVIVVKSPEQEAEQQARYRQRQDEMLADVGMSRQDFDCFDDVFADDELVIVVARAITNWDTAPKNLVDLRYNREQDRHEYTFMARSEEYLGNAPLLDCVA